MTHQLEPRPAEQAADDELPFETEGAADHKEDEAEGLHGPSVSDTEVLSPGRFFARLRNELAARGIDYETLPRRTAPDDAPACFAHFRVDYNAWLAAASHLGALVPYRYDEPAEPNYCYDCLPEFRKLACKAGVCQYPDAKFERRENAIRDGTSRTTERELVCVSRNKQKVITELQLRSLL